MKMDVVGLDGAKVKKIDLPTQFSEDYRPSLIKRAVMVIMGNLRQSTGAYVKAGMRQMGKLSRRRSAYKGAYKHGISRVPRKTMWRRGTQFGWEGAVAPGTKGGRRAHPPKVEKKFSLSINNKERRKAIRSALSGTVQNMTVIDSRAEGLSKTKDVIGVLSKIGFKDEVARCVARKIRAGKGKNRGRRYKTKQGPLFVVSSKCDLVKSLDNVRGFEVCVVNNLNAMHLTKGHVGARKTVWSESALDKMKKEKLFI